MGTTSSSTQYSNKDYFGSDLNSIAISNIKKYLGDPCIKVTNNGKNCIRSLKYTQDDIINKNVKTLNCTKYCIENSGEWIKDMFINIPKYIEYTNRRSTIKSIIYQL